MPAYYFEALQTDGKTRKGVIEADTVKSARNQLRGQSLIPITVEPAASENTSNLAAGGFAFLQKRAFSLAQLTVWTEQLAALVAAGLPIERALGALAEENTNAKQQALIAALRSEVNAGSSLATAMRNHPLEFSQIYIATIAAGEQSGGLDKVLLSLSKDLQAGQDLRAKLIGAALYPAIVTIVAFIIVIFLLSYVVPQIAGVFAGTKQTLPILTSIMLSISAFVRQWGFICLILLIITIIGVKIGLKSPAFSKWFDSQFLRLPLIGNLARGYNAARFGSTLSMLVMAGVPILKALQTAAQTLGNKAMKADAEDALIMVREGAPLAGALSQKKRFPKLLSMFARLGEQTGELPIMLERASSQLSKEVQRRAMNFATLLEPLLIVGMGIIVMLIVLAVMMPIIELNQWVK